jgi:hypothetical protein
MMSIKPTETKVSQAIEFMPMFKAILGMVLEFIHSSEIMMSVLLQVLLPQKEKTFISRTLSLFTFGDKRTLKSLILSMIKEKQLKEMFKSNGFVNIHHTTLQVQQKRVFSFSDSNVKKE